MDGTVRAATCACGRVRCEAAGSPILTAVCYCGDCQAGGAAIEALPGAAPVRDPDAGTPYLTYRDDRFACLEGEELLVADRLSPTAPTRRMVASCCNTGMYLKFEPGHWVSAYRLRFPEPLPPVEMRTNLRRRTSTLPLPDDAPAYRAFPLKLFWRLIRARLAMIGARTSHAR